MKLISDLRELLTPEQVSVNETVLEHHSRDESYHTPQKPDVVVFPHSTEDVVKVITYANQHEIPVVPYAIGSSLEGQVIPIHGGISLDMSQMDKILEIRPDDFLVHVQPGVTKDQLNAELARYGLFFSVDPGANASVGGMAATNASGTTTVRYGVMRDQVRALKVVLPDASVITTGSLAAKSASGLNLNGLFVGSEGTLGVFTELWLKVYGLPEAAVAVRATFSTIEQCVKASTAIMGAGIPVTRIELADALIVAAINRYKGVDYPVAPTLFLEFQGAKKSINYDVELAVSIMQDEGMSHVEIVKDEASRRRLWDSRHVAALAFRASVPGKEQMATDICVPLSKLPEAVLDATKTIEEYHVHGAVVGHVGDGNYHTVLLVDPNDEDEMQRVAAVNAHLVQFSLQCGGTCTGEHGVGLGKKKYQALEHGESLRLMKAIKHLLDPKDLMNPGKLVDD
ncbi:FAD-binding oxidoreductase [Sulfoacidibacillus thermotolerans]|uniref:D-lactate dehydrogenase (cytochrome) n=1 Tax=Sulfoacidibacillus thermotolerans TaxID=1765684 RepID=A0A2U3D6W3_SULT2|nr:FAD-linked oxidase C-terminal domain-containing protein [Sulfoacidibacillus thermotolerans]PWI57024.1 2-hydroxy-acid oxidase [Sulfoacidibacillus thermotolerans]